VSWLTSLPYPIALMACDDNQGNKIAEICKVNGIKIPEEIAVLGVDNDKTICSISDPPLSSINMTVDRGGYEVAKLIDTLIKEKRYQGDDIIIYSTDIVSRASTNIYATQDHHIALSLKYIHENYNKKIAVKDILNLVPLSRRLLELHFKEVTKQSIYQYILNLRMNLFAQYLLESDEPVSNIADLIGLRNDTNVARQFKILKGCTPSEYRRLYATQQYR
ncbi:MAG: substrate-binding domain-containing protein, partial [Bacteroidaceae bacterium]